MKTTNTPDRNMKIKQLLKYQSLALVTGLAVFAALCALPEAVRGQVQGGDLFVTVNLGGTYNNGASPIYQYTPQYLPPGGTPGLFASALDTPRGLAFDRDGNLYVATNTDVDDSVNPPKIIGTILKITSGGLMSTFATGFPVGFLQGLVTDSNSPANVFVVVQQPSDPNNPNANPPNPIYKIPPNGGTLSQFALLPSWGWGMAFDSAGNLYVAAADAPTANPNGEILRFAPNGTQDSSPFVGPAAFPYPSPGPIGLAFDAFGNLFVSTQDANGNGEIREFGSNGTEITPRFATGLTKNPRGLAFDSAGNLFLAEPGIGGIDPPVPGDILEFTPAGAQTVFASQNFGTRGNHGPEWLAFTTGAVIPPTTAVTLTLPDATTPLTATVTSIDQNSVPPPPSNFVELSGSNLAFDISTTATPTPPIIIAFTVSSSLDFSTLKAMHYECDTQNNCNWVDRTIRYECDAQNNCGWLDSTQTFHPAGQGGYPSNPTPYTVYGSVNSLSPFLIAKFKFKAQVQPPIKANGTSVFKRGVVVGVKFTLTSNGVATCQLPPATISLISTAGTILSGKNFRIDSTNCQYVYNLATSSLSTGTYQVNILIGGSVAGTGTFTLK
jgi:hypothetical protein